MRDHISVVCSQNLTPSLNSSIFSKDAESEKKISITIKVLNAPNDCVPDDCENFKQIFIGDVSYKCHLTARGGDLDKYIHVWVILRQALQIQFLTRISLNVKL